jgi:hypothetical protein
MPLEGVRYYEISTASLGELVALLNDEHARHGAMLVQMGYTPRYDTTLPWWAVMELPTRLVTYPKGSEG